MIRLAAALSVLAALIFPAAAIAQSNATITFLFSNPALTPPSYSLLIHPDGSGSYRQPAAQTDPPINLPITIDADLVQKLFSAARKHRFFAAQCRTSHAHVAFSGQKTLQYSGPDGNGTCTFNYAKDDQLNLLVEQLEAVGTTLDFGDRLAVLLAHDKLGLDAAIEQLREAQRSGQAADLGNIAPVLTAIAADQNVMEHTRLLAQSLPTK